MKRLALLFLVVHGLTTIASAQGYFAFVLNVEAPTHLGSIDGPMAGPGIWAQMLAGLTPDSLTPVGPAAEHQAGGLVRYGQAAIYVPFARHNDPGYGGMGDVFVQMVAWNATVWGTALSGVPPNQLGHTDTVQVQLSSGLPEPIWNPFFNQSAIVPSVPEPSIAALAALGALLTLHSRRCRSHHPTTTP